MLDLQQVATSLVDEDRVSQKILASIVSYYPGRVRKSHIPLPQLTVSLIFRVQMGLMRPYVMRVPLP